MPEVRLIDANALNTLVALYAAENAYLNDTPLDILRMVSRWIAETPTIDAVHVVHGRWKLFWADKRGRGGVFQCTACSICRPIKTDYCPNCGAKMDAKEDT